MERSMIFVLTLFVSAYGYDRAKLRIPPKCQDNFNLDKYLGKWYKQARLPSCTWSGASAFSDWTNTLAKDMKGIVSTETWRNDVCVKVSIRLTQKQPGVGKFVLKDTFGDVVSGDMTVVAVDYKSFVILWSCPKRDTDGTCADTSVTVKTRHRQPSVHTWKIIDAALMALWDLSLTEMQRISHDNECYSSNAQQQY